MRNIRDDHHHRRPDGRPRRRGWRGPSFPPAIPMKFLPAMTCLCLLPACSGCTSATYKTPGGGLVHVSTAFGDAKIAGVEAGGLRVAGYESANSTIGAKYLDALVISKLIPLGKDIVKSTRDVAEEALQR